MRRKKADALIEAVLSNDLSALKSLLDTGVDVNLTDVHGVTALMTAAAARGRMEAVNLLLVSCADVNLQDFQGAWPLPGQTALMFAASQERYEVVRLLLSRSADVNARDGGGENGVDAGGINRTDQDCRIAWRRRH
ncbi:MAG TPA: ankyrin repeat domain-containing protein [Blastocatellia bacterium]|nr:ankyrin repeat domain-containing protein [Blastocatellia bacterium]